MSITNSSVVELRQYTLKPGARDTLVSIFEAEFVESQEELGTAIGGLFDDRDDPDRFVWMRGFASIEARKDALTGFYFGSEAWKEHAAAANATMIDSDDVLLLRPTDPPHPPAEPGPRSPVGATLTSDEWVLVTVWLHESGHGTCEWLTQDVRPCLVHALGADVATWRTEPAENTFPALPVRPDHAFVWSATFGDEASYAAALAALESDPGWRRTRAELDRLAVTTQTLRLRPTARSSHAPPG